MIIKAKKSAIIRIIGAILILIGLCLSIVSKIQIIDSFVGSFLWIIVILPWIISYIILKLLNDFINDNIKIISYLLIIYSLRIFIIAISWNLLSSMIIILNLFLNLLLLNSWNLSLSIYKKKKIIFVISGLSYIAGTLIFNLYVIFLGPLIIIIMVSGGMVIILITEYIMHKKGYLNYI